MHFHEVLREIHKFKMAHAKWPPFGTYGSKYLWTYYLSFKSYCHSFNACKIMEVGVGGGGGRAKSAYSSLLSITSVPK